MKKSKPLQSETEEEAEEEQFSHERLLKPCVLGEVLKPVEPESDASSTRSIQLKPEDEISISSIISFLLGRIEPTEEEFKPCDWDLNAKDVLNEKNALLFDETLYISRLKNTNCKLSEYTKVFMERELEQVGKFCLGVEESYDGYVVMSKSQMIKGKDNCKCGHTLKGKYTDRFILICEKRTEYDFIDNARVEKSLEVRNYYDEELVAYRETKVNEDSKKLKAVIKIKDSRTTFLCDGGVMLLMRYMIINNFIGSYEYYSMNLFGKILRCTLTVHYERKTVRIFYRTYKGVKRVITTHYFDEEPIEISESFLTAEGHIVLHFWHGYNYVLHHTCAPTKPPEKILPKLELMWKCDNVLFRNYQLKKKLNYQNAICYLSKHPEFTDLLQDYVQCLLKYKPVDVMRFTISFFHNMRTENQF